MFVLHNLYVEYVIASITAGALYNSEDGKDDP